MAVIFAGMFTAFFIIVYSLPDDITFSKAFNLAKANGKINLINTSWDLSNRYTVWTGLIGGTFLALSYFGTDQSQVQRYLSSKSTSESQLGLLFNALLKVPMQFFILLVGVMVFVFYQFNSAPLNFNPMAEEAVLASAEANTYNQLESEKTILETQKMNLYKEFISSGEENVDTSTSEKISVINEDLEKIKKQSTQLIERVAPLAETNDKDYVFIHFILHHLPKGLIGLLLAVIISAAMSSTASELNALATTTVIDLYQPNTKRPKKDDALKNFTKLTTLIWGVIAILVACFAPLFENLIQLVNIIGSLFYGNILGIFLLGFFFKFLKGTSVFTAALTTQAVIIGIYAYTHFTNAEFSYLWLNLIGCVLVIILALVFSLLNLQTNNEQN